jgi:uncharacterized surface protein with fasciclin (FAS1) repeats
VYEGKLTPEEGRKEMRLYGQALPPVGTIAKPADASPFGVISKLAAKHEVIIVFNMVDLQPCTSCPGGEGQFNADVVVGAAGQLLATYHKSHLYGSSPLLDEPSRPDPTSFVAPSLGGGQVRFGMLICYDMQFLTPGAALLAQNITHFVFSTSWVNQPPLYVATMIQQGWSRRHGTVLIAANLTDALSSAESEFTVFAPNNAAFAKIPAADLKDLLTPANIGSLTEVLTVHVVKGSYLAIDLTNNQTLKTLATNNRAGFEIGSELTVTKDASGISIASIGTKTSKVIAADNVASNGVVHVVDTVMLTEAPFNHLWFHLVNFGIEGDDVV